MPVSVPVRFRVSAAIATISLWLVAATAQETAPAASDPYAQVRTALADQISRLDQQIPEAEAVATEERASQLGVSVQDLQDHALRLREIRSVCEDHLVALDDLSESKEALAAVNAEIRSYTGLKEPPPYTPWFVDELRDAVDAKVAQYEFAQRSLAQAKELAARLAQELKTRESELAVINDKLSVAADDAARRTLEWQVQQAQAARELLMARKALAEFSVELGQARLELRDRERELSERRQKDAESKQTHRPDDLESKRAEIASMRDALAKERAAADVQKDKAKKRLEEARENLKNAVEDEEYAVYQSQVELRRAEAEAAQEKATLLRDQLDYLYHQEDIWSTRYGLHTGAKFPLRQQRERLSDYRGSLEAARHALETREDVLRAEVRELTRRLAQMQQSVNTLDNTQAILKLRNAQLDQISAAMQVIERTEKLAARAIAEIIEVEKRQSFGERVQQLKETAQRVWDRELFNIDGRPLTVRKLGIALLILGVGLGITRVVTRLIRRAFRARPHVDPNAAAIVERLAHYGMLAFIVLFALQTVNIPLTVFTFLGGALAIGVGFGAQNLINNFISGLILMAERPIKIGDVVEVDGQRGRIAEIGARCSRLSLFSGIDILVPNSSFLEKNVVNWTLSDPRVRFSVRVGVDYGANTREVSRIIMNALEEHGKILRDPRPSVVFDDFGDNALMFEGLFWLNLIEVPDSRTVCSDIRHMIDKGLREAGIGIAYPQRDVHLDTRRPLDVRLVGSELDTGNGAEKARAGEDSNA